MSKKPIALGLLLDDTPGYMCVCGQVFAEHMERVLHGAYCETWRDHKLGAEVLSQFPMNKYGGYVIQAPAVLVAFVRAAIEREKREAKLEAK